MAKLGQREGADNHEQAQGPPGSGSGSSAAARVGAHLRELVPSTSGSVGGALAGLAIAGPGGAVLGAAVGSVVQHVVDTALFRRWERAGQAIEVAASEANLSPDALLRRLLEDERLLDLAATVVAAASETALKAKIRALGKALASGALATDDATIDEHRFLVATLADLEAPHVRVLEQVTEPFPTYEVKTSRDDPNPRTLQVQGWGLDDLGKAQPGLGGVVAPILSVLAGRGLIENAATGTLDYQPSQSERWVITDYGRRCLALLIEQACPSERIQAQGEEDSKP
jgi:hypothetical protein